MYQKIIEKLNASLKNHLQLMVSRTIRIGKCPVMSLISDFILRSRQRKPVPVETVVQWSSVVSKYLAMQGVETTGPAPEDEHFSLTDSQTLITEKET